MMASTSNCADWNGFYTLSWERTPTIVPLPLASAKEAFEIACRLGGMRQSGALHTGVHFSAESGELHMAQWMFPMKADGTFQGYHRRVRGLIRDEQFLLYSRGLQNWFPELVARATRSLAGLNELGASWEHLELELFVGRYGWTPIGVHREDCANFHHVISGRKFMLLWPPASLGPTRQSAAHADFGATRGTAVAAGLTYRPDCLTLSARKGEAIYFPRAYWHVGSSARLSIAINLALYGSAPAASPERVAGGKRGGAIMPADRSEHPNSQSARRLPGAQR